MEKSLHIEGLIARGAQHHVGMNAEGKMVKFPHRMGKLWDKSSYETVKRDLLVHTQYDVSIPETDVIQSPQILDDQKEYSAPYAIIAQRIRGEVLRELHLANPRIKKQMLHMVETSLQIRSQIGAALDFLGGEALGHFVRYLFQEEQPGQLGAYNLILNHEEDIVLIDTNLLDPQRAPTGLGWLVNMMIDLQHQLLIEMLDDPSLNKQHETLLKYRAVKRMGKWLFGISRSKEKKREQRQSQEEQTHSIHLPEKTLHPLRLEDSQH